MKQKDASGAETRSPRRWVRPAVAAVAVLALTVVLIQAKRTADRMQAQAHARVVAAAAPVESLMRAVADGDGDAALELIRGGLADAGPEAATDLLSDEAQAALRLFEPIEDVAVQAPSRVADGASIATVRVTYSQGGTPIEQQFTVVDPDGDGVFEVSGALGVLALDDFAGLDLQVNGIPVAPGTYAVLPGRYEVSTTTEYFTIAGESAVEIGFGEHADLDAVAELTVDGATLFRETVTAAVRECVDSRRLETGCGLSVPEDVDGAQITDHGVIRRLTDDAQNRLDTLEPRLLPSDLTIVRGGPIGQVEAGAVCSQDNSFGICTLTVPPLGSAVVDMTDPDLEVTWD